MDARQTGKSKPGSPTKGRSGSLWCAPQGRSREPAEVPGLDMRKTWVRLPGLRGRQTRARQTRTPTDLAVRAHDVRPRARLSAGLLEGASAVGRVATRPLGTLGPAADGGELDAHSGSLVDADRGGGAARLRDAARNGPRVLVVSRGPAAVFDVESTPERPGNTHPRWAVVSAGIHADASPRGHAGELGRRVPRQSPASWHSDSGRPSSGDSSRSDRDRERTRSERRRCSPGVGGVAATDA